MPWLKTNYALPSQSRVMHARYSWPAWLLSPHCRDRLSLDRPKRVRNQPGAVRGRQHCQSGRLICR
ncbi:hypothetical protein SAMN02745857_01803 [Andreprevotia lacus DSM 23236]|uniref:Uncharacterized protein n=1 Tax=Andreprevotia lacus DSM 23236 TaxID=1121001 RepID=A0A1W1XJV4_9NEIS|nr:hypothetical protein SAMN02745857_01803 [Andreprevotia lacus DSM 23236]